MSKITGTLIKNYFHCKRQAWLYYYGINFQNETTKVGEYLHQEKETKELQFDNIKIDDIDTKNNLLIEYKKTSSNLKGTKMQVLYYLKILKEKGLEFRGLIKDIEFSCEYFIELNLESEQKLGLFLTELELFLKEKLPETLKSKRCNNCSFYDYCFS